MKAAWLASALLLAACGQADPPKIGGVDRQKICDTFFAELRVVTPEDEYLSLGQKFDAAYRRTAARLSIHVRSGATRTGRLYQRGEGKERQTLSVPSSGQGVSQITFRPLPAFPQKPAKSSGNYWKKRVTSAGFEPALPTSHGSVLLHSDSHADRSVRLREAWRERAGHGLAPMPYWVSYSSW